MSTEAALWRGRRRRTRQRLIVTLSCLASATLTVLVTGVPPASAGTGFAWPASGRVSQNAAQHKASFENQYAQDIANTSGTAIVAAADGVVEASFLQNTGTTCTVDGRQYPGGYGNVVVVRHEGPTTYWTLYGHMASRDVQKGQAVSRGTRLGGMGSTGCSTGSHLHFQIGTGINSAGIVTAASSTWRGTDPASGSTYSSWTPVTQGAPLDGDYPGFSTPPPVVAGEGSYVQRQGANEIYRIAGGAPIYVSTWDALGGPQPTITLSAAQFDALRNQPADNTIVRGSRSGEIYRMVGGAPIYQGSCAAGCDPYVDIDDAAIANAGAGGVWDHLAAHPADGATARAVETGQVYKSVGGAFVYLYTCEPGCGSPASISQGTVDAAGGSGAFRFLRKHPADGATLRAVETGRIYKIAGGAPIYLNSCDAGCGLPVGLNQRAVDEGGLGALRTLPLDGTTLRAADTGRIYKVVGGTAFWLSTCDAGCGVPVTVMQAIIDSTGDGHLRTAPLDGTTVRSIPSGEHWRYDNGCRTRVAAEPAETVTDNALDVAPACDGPSVGPTTSPTPGPTTGPTPAPTEPTTPAALSVSPSPSTISAGQVTTVTYRGTPGSTVDILSRTQPATEFSRIGTVTLDGNGIGASTHRPQKNTRITARTAEGQLSAEAPIIAVRSVASFNAHRVGTRTYTFTGRVYPALNNRLVNIYRNGSLVAQARSDATGIYKVTRTLGAGAFTFQARTPNDQSNLGTNSPMRSVQIY